MLFLTKTMSASYKYYQNYKYIKLMSYSNTNVIFLSNINQLISGPREVAETENFVQQ